MGKREGEGVLDILFFYVRPAFLLCSTDFLILFHSFIIMFPVLYRCLRMFPLFSRVSYGFLYIVQCYGLSCCSLYSKVFLFSTVFLFFVFYVSRFSVMSCIFSIIPLLSFFVAVFFCFIRMLPGFLIFYYVPASLWFPTDFSRCSSVLWMFLALLLFSTEFRRCFCVSLLISPLFYNCLPMFHVFFISVYRFLRFSYGVLRISPSFHCFLLIVLHVLLFSTDLLRWFIVFYVDRFSYCFF